MVFAAAIFLSYGVNAFTTIYAIPGHPVHSFALWCSFISSIIAAGLWTAIAAKKSSSKRRRSPAAANWRNAEQAHLQNVGRYLAEGPAVSRRSRCLLDPGDGNTYIP